MAINAGKEPEPEPGQQEPIDNNASLAQLNAMLGGTTFGGSK